MAKYFTECKTKADLKAKFKELLKIHHPDNGGDVKVMQQINEEYARLIKVLPDDLKQTNKGKENKKKQADTSALSEALKAALAKVSSIEGLIVEVCGLWIWVSGNTYPVKDILKNAGYKFSGKKKMWYFHEETESNYRHWHKKETDMETIRSKYGSNVVHTKAACLA